MGTLIQDLRHSLRQLARKPVFTITAVLTLAIGMGVNAVAFSMVNGVLFKGFALTGLPNSGRIMTLPGGDEEGNASLAEFHRFHDATRDTLDIAAEGRSSVAWKHAGGTSTAWTLYVSPGYFNLVTPSLVAGQLRVGRDGAVVSAVIAERFWRESLASPSLAGLTLRLNNTDVAVAGVVAESFTGPAGIYSPDIWLPLDDSALFSRAPLLQQRDTRWLFVLGRLRDHATASQVDGEVRSAAADMARDWPETHKDRSARFRLFEERNSELRGIAVGASIGMAIIGLVLLLACFNVANLLLARAVEREREMGVRAALGAKPWRLIRLVVTEGVLIATLSGVLALVLAWWTQSLVGSFAIPVDQPQHIDLTPDRHVVFFVGLLIVIAGVLPGIWPAIAASRVDVLRVLGSQGASAVSARPSAMRRWLVGAQIAGSTMFLAVAGLFIQSHARLATFDVGFARDELVLADFDPVSNGYDATASARYVAAFSDRVRALPGVSGTAIADRAPFFVGFDRTVAVWPPGQSCAAGDCRAYPVYAVSPGYFRAMGIALTEGREFGGEGAQAVINGAMARALWPDRSPLGDTIRIGDYGGQLTIVGITASTRTRGLDRETPAIFIQLTDADYQRPVTIVARAAGPPVALVRPIIDTAAALDPNVALVSVRTMDERMRLPLWPFRTLSWLFSICGALALLLATVGVASVVIHAVNRRVREFGVRLSVGATRQDLMREVLGSSVRMLLPGLITGLMMAAIVAKLAQAIFVGVNVLNPIGYVAVALLQSAIVMLACIGPAVRASRVDPLAALRGD